MMSFSTFGINLKFLTPIVLVQWAKELNHKMLRNRDDLAYFKIETLGANLHICPQLHKKIQTDISQTQACT